MATCVPFLFRRKILGFGGKELPETKKKSKTSNKPTETKGAKVHNSCIVAGNINKMAELRTKVLTFRDLLDLPPCAGSASTNKLVITTVKDLHAMYPDIVPRNSMSETKGTPIHQALTCFCDALKSIGDMWMGKDEWVDKHKCSTYDNMAANELEKHALELLNDMIKTARERVFHLMDDDELVKSQSPRSNSFGRALSDSYSDKSPSGSPATPTSVLSQMITRSPYYQSPLLFHAVGKLNPIDVKRLSFHLFSYMAAAPEEISSMTVEGLKQVKEAKNESGIIEESGIEDTNDCEKVEDIPKILMTNPEKISSDKGRNWTGNPNIPPAPSPETLARAPMDVLLPPPSLPKLRPNVAAAEALPPPLSTLTKGEVSTLPPSPVSQNVVVSPPPPPSLPPPPPPSPPKMAPNVAPGLLPLPPPPLPFMTSGHTTMPPLPPSPPMTSSNEATPPPPPGMSSKRSVPPPAGAPPGMSSDGSVPPPPPGISSNRSVQAPPPTMTLGKGAAPPPPPALGGGRSLCLKKAATKLKRSSQMGSLYRFLKGKVEGSSTDGKSSQGKKSKIGASTGGKQGMADALAEITKRSAYFQQIEEDVKSYAITITEVKIAISNFQTTDMSELLQFHKYVESHLEKLTDESQVLARFEGFPGKKLEALRMAAALYTKLDTLSNTLKNWKIEGPLGQLLDKTENFFNKIKVELDSLERIKDDESKKFQSHKINFDFGILVRIKELMVDVSSSCMELALKEKREAKSKENEQSGSKTEGRMKGSTKMLWRAFQFAFRVYTFAGGHDDRADKLTRELAQEIESDPHH